MANQVPPLRYRWRSTVSLAYAVHAGERVYGITYDGRVASLDAAVGGHIWQTSPGYLKRLGVSGNKLYIYKRNQGLAEITDNGSWYQEKLILAMDPVDESASLSHPMVEGDSIYLTHQNTLIALTRTGSPKYGVEISGAFPTTLMRWGTGRLLVVDGRGQPSLWTAGATRFTEEWSYYYDSPGEWLEARPALIHEGRLYVGSNIGVNAFDITGARLWQATNVKASALAGLGDTVYAARGGAVWSVQAANGAVNWQRNWLYPTTEVEETGVAAAGGFVYVGNVLSGGSRADLFALRTSDGLLVWQPRGGVNVAGSGLPLLVGETGLITYGSVEKTEMMGTMEYAAQISGTHVTHDPRPLRGHDSGFAGSKIHVNLPVGAAIQLHAWREGSGLSQPIQEMIGLPKGTHTFTWNAGLPNGFSSASQFGRIVMDVVEDGTNLRYTVASPVPVNTMPDIIEHWGKDAIETMLYHKYVNGYPDLTFKPDNLVTRAESATIIAKTKNLEGPSEGFQTKFTDIAGHWAESYIKALEERDIISGFLEADGTYTYRPENQMTRAQEARVLVRAYEISPAPSWFQTKFTDIAGHWAEADIKALEHAGYVNGFREPDGTYTYRPEQFLTRAELCAMVVRIRRLTRP